MVDINNLISLESYYSVGSYDLENIVGDIIFDIGEKSQSYEGIGRGEINLENLPLFKDEVGNFGSTTSDSTKAMIKDSTTHIIMNIVSFAGKEKLEKWMKYAGELLESYAEGKVIEWGIIE